MHAHRRPVSPFNCCDPLREFCVGRSHSTMYDHARARAHWTGYRQKLHWSTAYGGWIVYGTSARLKLRTRPFDNDVKPQKVDAE